MEVITSTGTLLSLLSSLPLWPLLLLLPFLAILIAEAVDTLRRRDNLGGQLVVITGAAGELGRMLALEFALAGSVVALWDIREPALQAVRDWLINEHRVPPSSIHCAVVDVSDAGAVAAGAEALKNALGRSPGVVVSNAGVVPGKSVLGFSDTQLERSFRINALSHFWCARTFVEQMLQSPSRKGVYVTVGSVMAAMPSVRLADYCASKAAVAQLHECLRCELRATAKLHSVHCLHVQPYAIDTPLFEGAALLGRGRRWQRYSLLRWVLPPLDARWVAGRVVRAVQTRRVRIVLPRLLFWITAALPLLPVSLRDLVLDVAGSRGMDDFHGRPSHLFGVEPGSQGAASQLSG